MPNQNNALSIQSLGDSKKQKLDICFFIVQNSFTWDMSCVKCALIFFLFHWKCYAIYTHLFSINIAFNSVVSKLMTLKHSHDIITGSI